MMKRTQLASLALLIPVAVMAGAALAQERGDELRSSEFTYFGELRWLDQPYTGEADLIFTLWDQPTNGAQVAAQQLHERVIVIDGLFQAKLSFAEGTITDAPLWLEIAVRAPAGEGEFATLAPRQSVRPRGNELRNREFEDEHSDDVSQADPQDDGEPGGTDILSARSGRMPEPPDQGSTVGPVRHQTTLHPEHPDEQPIRILSPSPWTVDSNGIHYDAGHVGVGDSAHGNFTLSVKSGPGDGAAIFSRTDEPSGWGYYSRATGPRGRGIFGTATSSTGKNFGVYGVSFSDEGQGVFGWAKSETGVTYGVYGQTDSDTPHATGVYGLVSSSFPGMNSAAVRGQNNGTLGNGLGVWGSQNGSGWGVLGEAVRGVGVYGRATASSGTNYGVVGVSSSASGFDFFANGPGTNYGASSSIRWKHNIEPIDDPLYKVAQLRGVYFDWDEEHGGHHDVGMIAEEVGKVLPEIVNYEENGIDAIGMDYSKLTPLLVEAVKALHAQKDAQIAAQRREIESLRAHNEQFADRLDVVEERLQRLEQLSTSAAASIQ